MKGKKVILRPVSLKDAPNFCRWLEDREVTKFLDRYDNPPTLKEEREYILEQRKKKDHIQFSIDSVDGAHIGVCSLMKISAKSKRAEFGIFIGDKKYWGQGCGTEACRLIVDYGFKKLRLHRVYLRVFGYNIRGIKSYQKVGFKIEGRLREQVYRDGFYHDMIFMGILRNEYLKNKK
ncbi:MAG: GNAT family N-acetyltransferase [Candidatus Buchananbacteria bacterium]|nr:GNAT family N-acetyltransferase [Candidatus Buchananbacteria bacterium]